METQDVLAIAVIAALLGGCVDLDKPQAVALCSIANNCSDDPNTNDGGAPETQDAPGPEAERTDGAREPGSDGTPEASPADRASESSLPDLADAAGAELPPEAGPTPESPPEGLVELAPEPSVEPAPEPAVEPGPESIAEPRLEPARESGPEPGPEAGREPSPEPVPEPAPDAGPPACASGATCDDFEDGDYTANPVWSAPGGFSVTSDGSKALAYTGSETPAVALLGGKATALTLTARVKATAFGGTSNSYRVGLFARANSQGTPSSWYALTITGDGSLRLQATDSTPAGCNAVADAAVAGTWYVLTLKVGGTVASTTLEGTLTDAAGGNARTIGPCTVTNGLAAGWAGVGVRGGGTHGEWDEVKLGGVTP